MYQPNPIDTSDVQLPSDLIGLRERIAEHVHDHWALLKIEQGKNDPTKLDHPDLVPYLELPEDHREYDRNTAEATIKLLIALGYQILLPINDIIAAAETYLQEGELVITYGLEEDEEDENDTDELPTISEASTAQYASLSSY